MPSSAPSPGALTFRSSRTTSPATAISAGRLGFGQVVAELGDVGHRPRLLPEHDPDDLRTQLLVILLAQRPPVDRPRETALAEDRDVVAERERLVELVRDEDHRLALLLQPREHLRQLCDALRREHRRRLVEDEHPRAAPQRLDDLHLLLVTEGEVDRAARRGRPRPRGAAASSARRFRAPSSSRRNRRVSPSIRFSRTVSAGISAECWGTVPMPSSSAVRGDEIAVSIPSIRIVPASGRFRPERMPIRVDLPAPFSPSRQCTSPRRSVRSMRSFASTPGNAFVIPASSTIGVSVGSLTLVGSVCLKTRDNARGGQGCDPPRAVVRRRRGLLDQLAEPGRPCSRPGS